MRKQILHYGLLALIILFGAVLRYFNNSWDSGYMLHPDERFLTMVTAAMQVPASFAEYLDPAISKFYPPNINYTFYVYGVLPLVMNKFLALWNLADGYPTIGIFGRTLSATFDVITMLVVYKIARLVQREYKIKGPLSLLAVFFYAISVEAIQLSHFFTTDIFQTTFMLLTLLFCLDAAFEKRQIFRFLFVAAAGVTFALALACKVSAIYMAPLYGALIYVAAQKAILRVSKVKEGTQQARFGRYSLLAHYSWVRRYFSLQIIIRSCVYFGLFALIAYVVLRLANPYYFETSDFFDITPNKIFMANIEQLEGFNSKEGYFPPAIQWMNKPPVVFSLVNLAAIGLGVPLFILVVAGIGVIIVRYRALPLMLIVFWSLGYFLYHSVSFVKVMRYTIFLYPVFALYAAFAVSYFLQNKPRWLYIPIIILTLIWPLMFMNIYMQPHSRVAASYWIHDKLPSNSSILSEHWDDGLPLLIPGSTKYFSGEQLEVFGPDDPSKFMKMQDQMSRADYYILSSNRAWGSIPTVPDKYPIMSRWYDELFAGKHGYTIIKTFTVYPSLEWLGIPLTMPDDWAEESFTVYDHPKVIIMENISN